MGQLAAGVAHEINTPAQFVADNISFIRDSFQELSELLSEYQKISAMTTDDKAIVEQQARIRQMETDLDLEFLTDELPRAIGEAEDGLKRISSIVRSMKEFAHPSSDAKAVFDLNVAIKRTVNVARNEWKYSAELEFQFAKEVIEVPGFEGEFNQVILIMVVNAAQAIREDHHDQYDLVELAFETRHLDDFFCKLELEFGA
ncbi:MAG: histidine kinase, partial [Pseudomonadota bacterium]